jgi:hypothetical protein
MPRRTSAFLPDLCCKITKASSHRSSRFSIIITTPHKPPWVRLHPNRSSLLLVQLHVDNIPNRPLSRQGYPPQLRKRRKHHILLLLRLRHHRARPQAPRRDPNITLKNSLQVLGQVVCILSSTIPSLLERKCEEKSQNKTSTASTHRPHYLPLRFLFI